MLFTKTLFTAAAWCLAFCPSSSFAASSADWRTRSIYQVMTDRFARTDGSTTATCNTGDQVYCGGSWKGIQNNLDYIQGMGFDAVWISPVTYQMQGQTVDGSSYHGYWQQDLYRLNSAFGTASDLQNLASALHSRGMYLMVDIVVNHFGWDGKPSSVTYSNFNPFNSQSYFHPYAPINYNNETCIEQCWLGDTTVPLPDLRTENSNVASMYQTWIKQLVSNYSIDGLRVDTMMQVNPGFWPDFESAAGVYAVGEVNDASSSYVCQHQSYGLPGVLNYAVYFPLFSAFTSTSGSISNLANMISATQSACADVNLLGTFSENQDQPRFAGVNSDMALAQNVIAFTMLTDGIPIIYEGQEQHYESYGGQGVPYNREAIWFSDYNTQAPLYELVTLFNKARKMAINDDSSFVTINMAVKYTDTTTIALKKGKMSVVLSNKGINGANYTQQIGLSYSSGQQVTELITCNTLTADSSGNLVVPMGAGQARIYYPTASLSGLCGASSKKMIRSAVAVDESLPVPKSPTPRYMRRAEAMLAMDS